MRKFLILLGLVFITCSASFAAKIPDDVRNYIEKNVPGTDVRFDGVIILPDNTIYLPLFPSLFSDISEIKVKESSPANRELKQKPDMIIFNNDFALLKVLPAKNGQRTVLHMSNPPLQIRTGLLPQDMLVPSGLIIPENLKGIIGNLKIDTKSEDVIFSTEKESFEEFLPENTKTTPQDLISQLKGKVLYVTTNYSKNIQVLYPAQPAPKYSLAQKSVPIDIEVVNNGKFILVTSHERPYLDIVSVADSRFIKQIDLSAYPEEIVIDETGNKAYVTAPKSSVIFVVDLKTMTLIQKIRVNGYCERLMLSGDKIFYFDKMKNDIWAIETNNEYTLKNVGRFPNVSAIAYSDGKLFIASRTKGRLVVVDYNTLELVNEFTTVSKPIGMQVYDKTLYVLGAQNNTVQMINTENGEVIGSLELGTDGFSGAFNRINGTNLAIISDIKNSKYSIIDLSNGKLLKTYSINVPIKNIVISDRIKLFE